MKRYIFAIAALVATSCVGSGGATKVVSQNDDNIEVLYFHSKHHCETCEAIETLSREVVDSFGSKEVEMKVIDITTKEGEAIADSYQVAWSSLVIDNRGEVTNQTELGYTYAKDKPEEYKRRLKELINGMRK